MITKTLLTIIAASMLLTLATPAFAGGNGGPSAADLSDDGSYNNSADNAVPATPKPALDDLCAALARFLHCLERADRNTLTELHEGVCSGHDASRPLNRAAADVIMAEILRRRR